MHLKRNSNDEKKVHALIQEEHKSIQSGKQLEEELNKEMEQVYVNYTQVLQAVSIDRS